MYDWNSQERQGNNYEGVNWPPKPQNMVVTQFTLRPQTHFTLKFYLFATKLHWLINLFLGVLFFILIRMALPAALIYGVPAGLEKALKATIPLMNSMSWLVLGFFLVTASVSAYRAFKIRRANKHEAAINALRRMETSQLLTILCQHYKNKGFSTEAIDGAKQTNVIYDSKGQAVILFLKYFRDNIIDEEMLREVLGHMRIYGIVSARFIATGEIDAVIKRRAKREGITIVGSDQLIEIAHSLF